MLNIQRTKKSHDSNFSFHCEKSVQASSCDELQVVLAHSSIYDVLTRLWELFEAAPLSLLSANTGA